MAATYGWYAVYSALQPSSYRFHDDQYATLEHDLIETPVIYRWSSDKYQLSGGYASARTVHQVFVAAPIKTDSRIDVSRPDGSDSIKLTNRFKDEVKLLVVKANGELYFAQNLAPLDSRLVTSTTAGDFSKKRELKEFFKELLPANTQEYRFAKRRRYYGFANSAAKSNSTVSRNNFGIEQIIAFNSAAGIIKNLEDGHYIAILDSMSEVPSVIPGAREIDGRVFVHGRW